MCKMPPSAVITLIESDLSEFPTMIHVGTVSMPFDKPLVVDSMAIYISSRSECSRDIPTIIAIVILTYAPVLELGTTADVVG